MSSGVESGGSVAAIIMLPVGVALGAGWLAWEAGKIVLEANRAIDNEIKNKKREAEEVEKQRKRIAIAGHDSLVETCHKVLRELDSENILEHSGDTSELELMRQELEQICQEPIPENPSHIESLNSRGILKLDRIISRKRKLAEIRAMNDGEYEGLSIADLMDDLRIAFFAANVHETIGLDVKAANPTVLERSNLNSRLADVSARITSALEFVSECSKNNGLSRANTAWFYSCFNGVDIKIQELCSPLITNAALKKGIQTLEEILLQFEMLRPNIEIEYQRFSQLYSVYVDAAKGLGERVYPASHFDNSDEIEGELKKLKRRVERAQQCAEIYRKLGDSAYMCYAWDQELKALGYNVYTRKMVTQLAEQRPERASIGETPLPFYKWDEQSMTQFYSISPQSSLQIIVHPDGTTTMQALTENKNELAEEIQKLHCDRLDILHKRLRENWFVCYDYQETASANEVKTTQEWRRSNNNRWNNHYKDYTDVAYRTNEQQEQEKALEKR